MTDEWGTFTRRYDEAERATKAVKTLRTYQRDYPDYDSEDWSRAVEDAFTAMSVLCVAWTLAYEADWSMRGIEMSLDEISKRACFSKGATAKAAKRLEVSGFIVVSRRKAMSNGHEVWQKPNSYRLVIPGAPVWSVPQEPTGFDATAPTGGDDSPFAIEWRRRFEAGEPMPF